MSSISRFNPSLGNSLEIDSTAPYGQMSYNPFLSFLPTATISSNVCKGLPNLDPESTAYWSHLKDRYSYAFQQPGETENMIISLNIFFSACGTL